MIMDLINAWEAATNSRQAGLDKLTGDDTQIAAKQSALDAAKSVKDTDASAQVDLDAAYIASTKDLIAGLQATLPAEPPVVVPPVVVTPAPAPVPDPNVPVVVAS